MNSDTNENRIAIVNNIFLFALSLLAIYFGKERSVFFDGADWMVEIVRNNNNYTPHYRFSVGINGILPWICSYFTKDIMVILYAFVVNYALTPVLFFLLLRYYLKSEKFVTLFLLGFCLFHLLVFFHPNHDAVTGYYYLILFTAFLSTKSQIAERNYLLKIFTLTFLVVLTHLTQYLFLFIIIFYVYYYLNNRFSLKKVLGIAFFILILKFFLLSSGYEIDRYTQTFSILNKIQETLNSTLVISFYKSLVTFNLPFTVLLILVSIPLIAKKEFKVLILFIILPLLFILYFMSFYFGKLPHSFATEGYFKSVIIIPVYIFVSIYIFNPENDRRFRLFLLIAIYSSGIVMLSIHGLNYKKYYNNIAYVTKQINQNTIFIDKKIHILDEFYIMHRHSTIINMIENDKCNYFHVTNDTSNWINNAYIQDTIAGGFCFKQKPIFKKPSIKTIEALNAEYNLINNYNF